MFDFLFEPYLTTPIKTFLGGFVAAIIGIVIYNVLRPFAMNRFCKSKDKRLWDTPARPITPTPLTKDGDTYYQAWEKAHKD